MSTLAFLLNARRTRYLKEKSYVEPSYAAALDTQRPRVRARVMLSRAVRQAAGSIVFVIYGATTAQAHAHLDHTVPAAGSTVHAAPQQIELSFSEAVEPAFSTVEVLDQKGGHVEQGKPELELGSAKLLRVTLQAVTPGTYKVVWRVVSVDSHRSAGSFTFSVAP